MQLAEPPPKPAQNLAFRALPVGFSRSLHATEMLRNFRRAPDCSLKWQFLTEFAIFRSISQKVGYLVVMADYEGIGVTEEYIDLLPILNNLYLNPKTFLKDIHSVKIGNYEC